MSDPQNQAMVNLMKEQGLLDHIDVTDDPIHLQPVFTEEEAKLSTSSSKKKNNIKYNNKELIG